MIRLVRAGLLILVSSLALISVPSLDTLGWCGLLAVAALPGLLAPEHPVIGRLGRLAEVVVVGLSTAALATPYGSTLPFLIAPVRSAAVFAGSAEALGLAGIATLIVLGVGGVNGHLASADYLIPAALWLLVALAGGLAGRRMYPTEQAADHPQPYAAATRLLTQLRTVARQLPGGTLDLGGIAAGLLDELGEVASADRAAVLGRSGGGRLVVLAQRGPDRTDWETSLSADTPITDAWVSQQPHVASRSLSRSAGTTPVSALVIPLVAGVRTIGLLAVEADRPGAYPPEVVAKVRGVVGAAALRLEAALLFDDVRALATTEERQRLAREIHDGVAQELVMVGYGIDNAVGQLTDVTGADSAIEDLHILRAEVTRVITELRLSLFELRTDVDPSGGLATALADYARTVGATGGMRVHLSLDESTARLPATVETELLRIGQEAVTNARKHAHAENLWVTCEIDPPYARIEVSDDGLGMSEETREGSYGLSIMAERSRRIRADLRISQRKPSGTTIAAVLGTRPRAGSVSAADGMEADNARQRDPGA